ncbi:MAG: agmatinase [Anaerovoracaceae bacterium]
MKPTKEMIKDELWGGLHSPLNSYEEADIVVFGIPVDENASYRKGTSAGPAAIRDTTKPIPPTTEYFEDISSLKVLDIGDIDEQGINEEAGMVDEQDTQSTASERSVESIFAEARSKVGQFVRDGKFFTMIGGDHSVTIPVLEGINENVDEPFGIIHIDAHLDLCDDIDGNKLSHGSTERRATEMKNVGSVENIFFLGIRSCEMDEHAFMQGKNMNLISAAELDEIGVDETIKRVIEKMSKFSKVYLTVDIDCLDPGFAPGTGTPKFGGLTPRQLLKLLRGIFDLPIIGFDLVEVAPNLDSGRIAQYAAQRIITECWGHYWRKK